MISQKRLSGAKIQINTYGIQMKMKRFHSFTFWIPQNVGSENASFPLGFEAILKGVRNTKGIQRKYAAREAHRGEPLVLGGSSSRKFKFANFFYQISLAKVHG